MTQYTREELLGIRKYKRELKRKINRTIEFTIKCAIVAGAIYLAVNLLSHPSIECIDDISQLDKYSTVQSYVDDLNSLGSTPGQLSIETVYGDLYKEVR